MEKRAGVVQREVGVEVEEVKWWGAIYWREKGGRQVSHNFLNRADSKGTF